MKKVTILLLSLGVCLCGCEALRTAANYAKTITPIIEKNLGVAIPAEVKTGIEITNNVVHNKEAANIPNNVVETVKDVKSAVQNGQVNELIQDVSKAVEGAKEVTKAISPIIPQEAVGVVNAIETVKESIETAAPVVQEAVDATSKK